MPTFIGLTDFTFINKGGNVFPSFIGNKLTHASVRLLINKSSNGFFRRRQKWIEIVSVCNKTNEPHTP